MSADACGTDGGTKNAFLHDSGRKRPVFYLTVRCGARSRTTDKRPKAPGRPHYGGAVLAAYNAPHFAPIGHLLASYQEISTFLAEVERRAFKQAMFAVRDEQAALDVVQDAMLKLTEKYADKPVTE